MTSVPPSLTTGTLLGGRVQYQQFAHGYRTGIEPVLLAAAIPARGTQRVIEAGTGAGAALLCLAHRLPAITGLGVEADPDLASLAASNATANLWPHRLSFQAGRIEDIAHLPPLLRSFDHALANPPWHDAAGTPSPDPARDQAKRTAPGLLESWVHALAACLRYRGTLSLILPPSALPQVAAAFAESGCGSLHLIPFWPKPGRPAKLMIIHAVRGGRAPLRLLPGIVLHAPGGGYTAAAARILTQGEALDAALG